MWWIQLWKSICQYRAADGYAYDYKDCIFCDDGHCFYQSQFIHSSRTPKNLSGNTRQLPKDTNMGFLHFNFVNWRNVLIKKAWYRCLEHIRVPDWPVEKINRFYKGQSYSLSTDDDDENVVLKSAFDTWFNAYDFFDQTVFEKPDLWRENQVLGWFEQYGKSFFKDLEIWNIDWGMGL